MAHVSSDKTKIVNRLRRLKGQIEGIERLVANNEECIKTLQALAACRGALNGLFSDLARDHLLHHVVSNPKKPSENNKAALELAQILKSYWK